MAVAVLRSRERWRIVNVGTAAAFSWRDGKIE